MASLLGEVDTNVPNIRVSSKGKAIKSESRRKVRILSPPIHEMPRKRIPKTNPSELLDTPPSSLQNDEHDYFTTVDQDDVPMSDPLPSSPVAKAVERKGQTMIKVEEDDDDAMEISQMVGDHKVQVTSVNISGARPAPKVIKKPPYPSPESSSPTRPTSDAIDPSTWNDVNSRLNVVSSPASQSTGYGKVQCEDVVEEDGTIRFFWTDYTEVNGNLCLFGKAKNRINGSYISAFVKVENILRKLYFLPRTHLKGNSDLPLCFAVC